MKRTIINTCMFGIGVLALTSCSDPMDEITSLIVGRNFSPTNFEAKNVTRESASLQWTVSSGATSYNLEIFEDDSLAFEGTPVQTFTNISASQIPYLVEGLTYDTKYSARVMAVDDNDNSRNSVWNGVYFRTNAQQIFKAVDPLKDVLDRSATFYWPTGEAVTKIAAKFTDDNGRTTVVVSRNLTEEEIAAGKATVEGLSPATKYTINLYNGEKERGSKTITTIADMTGKTIVQEGENLKSILANAADGEQFVLMPGTYQIPSADDDGTTSSAVLKTNVSIEGMYPTAKPVIQGRFEINGAKSVEITNVILDGSKNNSSDQTFNFKEAASDLQKLVVKDSEIKNFVKGLYYINVAAQIKEVTFNGCDIHDIACEGGDFLDCRKGYIESLNLKNCTFYNSCATREFIRYDNGKLNDQTVITVDHCTLNGISNASGKRLLYVRNGCSNISWTNNIVTNTVAVWSNQASTTVPDFKNNVYNACPNLNNEVLGPPIVNAFKDGTAKEADPKYKDAANGDFTVGDESVAKLEVGAEKWYK